MFTPAPPTSRKSRIKYDTFEFTGLFGDKVESHFEFVDMEGRTWRRIAT